MSKRAEEYAAEYVKKTHSPSSVSDFQAAMNIAVINGCKAAYEQAERDLALVPEDMGVIFNLVRELQAKYTDIRGCYEESLKMFNDAKNGK